MNRYMVGLTLALLVMTGADSAAGQARARVEIRNGRFGVGVAVGNRPVRVIPQGRMARGWVAADWGPVRIRLAPPHRYSVNGTLSRSQLRKLIGKNTVKRIERHAKRMGIRGKTRGRVFGVDRTTTLLEVTVNRVPVAELYDYGSNGFIDRISLLRPPHF